jgi:sigma-E factor negative regulatory protein RseA
MQRIEPHELISAMADGELDPEDMADGLARLSEDGAARAAWRDYHLVGDVLRSADLALATPPDLFLARLSARLAQEAPPAAQAQFPLPQAESAVVIPLSVAPPAANDGSFRWKLVAGLASAAAVMAVGWTVLGDGAAGSFAGARLAGAPAGVPQQMQMIRDPQLDELLAAHRQHGDATALQMPAGFLRNATFEVPGR